jgi:hypothetical protein
MFRPEGQVCFVGNGALRLPNKRMQSDKVPTERAVEQWYECLERVVSTQRRTQ